jgi:hypothetical protein
MLRLVMAKDSLELQHSELRHHAASHAQDDSKKLKYEQMVAIRDAVVTAPQLSASMLRRNMKLHDSPTKTIPAEHMRSFQHQVYRSRTKLCAQQLKGFNLDDSYGKLHEFAVCHLRSTLVHRHNDPEDGYHIGFHDFCLICHQNEAAFDVLHMNMSSLWMLTHAFRAIKAGWGFQLNADVTCKLCRKSVDLLAFSVTSILKRNNTLCLCIIPSTTESEQTYTIFYNELRKAVCLVPSIKPCDEEDSVSCGIITALLADAEVAAYVKPQKCKECILPVQMAMRDNFKGWGYFAENVLGIKSNVCISHATGNVQLFCAVACDRYRSIALRFMYCGGKPFTRQAVSRCCCLRRLLRHRGRHRSNRR